MMRRTGPMQMEAQHKILVCGHRGLVGSAIVRRLQQTGHQHILTRTRTEMDLTDQRQVNQFFAEHRPDFVFLAAARVGGILANNMAPGDFIRENLLLQTNVIDAAYRHGAKKLLFLGSNCIYPKVCPQPVKEEYLMTGPLEPTNSAYAVAKIAGLEMCAAYRRQFGFRAISLMPCNLYGPHDNFDPLHSHVMPALIRKFHEARMARTPQVTLWGTGQARREFLHVDDVAEACCFCIQHYDEAEALNIGAGTDQTIAEVAALVAQAVGYEGKICFDASRPDGTLRKLLDVTRLHALGWSASISLVDGIRSTYEWFQHRLTDSAQTLRL